MTYVRDEIAALPESERLDYAVALIETLLPTADELRAITLRNRYELTDLEAKTLIALDAVYPRHATREHLHSFYNEDVSEAMVNVVICKLRKKLTGLEVENVWGRGYRLSRRVPCLEEMRFRAPQPTQTVRLKTGRLSRGANWTQEDVAELVRMWDNGSDLHAIADELGRSERACQEKYRSLQNG